MAQNLHELRLGPLCYVKNCNQLRWLLSEKRMKTGQQKKVLLNTDYDCLTRWRNKNCNNYEYFLIICYEYVYIFVCAWVHVKLLQSCLTLCNAVDLSPPGTSVHGILQARRLEWVAISFSRGSSRPRDRTHFSHIVGRRFNLWAIREALLLN